MKKSTILFSIMIIIAIIAITLITICHNSEKSIEKGDCYDERNNKINELTCDVIVYEKQNLMSISLILIAFMMFFGFMGLLTQINEDLK